jgi:23S rRNA pseudouridine2605 synthase
MIRKTRGEKIQKVLAGAGVSSRRGAEELIRQGLVRVNGTVIDNPAIRVDPAEDLIECRGVRLLFPSARARGLILYKVAGYVTSKGDPHNRNTVYDLLPKEERDKKWLYAGRLDKDTEGLLFFTDSGELVHRLTHPSYKVKKQYRVKVQGKPTAAKLKALVRGVRHQGRLMRMDRVRILKTEEDGAVLIVELHHGEKRQVKIMLGKLGHEVLSLCRTRFGPLSLIGLKPGQSRRLTEAEMDSLISEVLHQK